MDVFRNILNKEKNPWTNKIKIDKYLKYTLLPWNTSKIKYIKLNFFTLYDKNIMKVPFLIRKKLFFLPPALGRI